MALGQHGGQLRWAVLAWTDRANELLELHPVRARRPADELERLVWLESVPFGDDPLGLLDRHAGLKRALELRPPLVGGLRHREEPAERSGCFLRRPSTEGLECLGLCLFVHGSRFYGGPALHSV
jgi:hypothetical protein